MTLPSSFFIMSIFYYFADPYLQAVKSNAYFNSSITDFTVEEDKDLINRIYRIVIISRVE